MPSEIQRRIFFYKGITGNDERGRPLPLSLTQAATTIDDLPYTPEGRYQTDEEDNALLVVIDAPNRWRLGVTRRSGLPLVERSGNFQELPIPDRAGLFEPTHIVLFPKGIVGAEFNFYGPRISRLPRYLGEKAAGTFNPFTLATLARQDVEQRLAAFEDVRRIEIQIHKSQLEVIAEADKDLARSMRLAAEATGAEVVDYVLKPERKSAMGSKAKTLLRRVVGREDFRERYDKLRIRGFNAATEEIEAMDLLRDDLIAVKSILRQDDRGRAVNPNSMYAAIESAHRDLKDLLEQAAAVVLVSS